MRVSVTSDGQQANGPSRGVSISDDGNVIAFSSSASNLVPNDTNGSFDVFVHDVRAGETSRVSIATDGTEANDPYFGSVSPAISADGNIVAFISSASNLVPGDTNQAVDVFTHDRDTGTTERVSVSTDGIEADNPDFAPSSVALSGDGRFVAFDSGAANLVADDTNGTPDIFLHDRVDHSTSRISVATDGTQANGPSSNPSLSRDGTMVAFDSDASTLVVDDTNGVSDVFLNRVETGETSRISVGPEDEQANNASAGGAVDGQGLTVVFSSLATNLTDTDTDEAADVFARRMDGATELISGSPDVSEVWTGQSSGIAVDAAGSYFAFVVSPFGSAQPSAIAPIYLAGPSR